MATVATQAASLTAICTTAMAGGTASASTAKAARCRRCRTSGILANVDEKLAEHGQRDEERNSEAADENLPAGLMVSVGERGGFAVARQLDGRRTGKTR